MVVKTRLPGKWDFIFSCSGCNGRFIIIGCRDAMHRVSLGVMTGRIVICVTADVRAVAKIDVSLRETRCIASLQGCCRTGMCGFMVCKIYRLPSLQGY